MKLIYRGIKYQNKKSEFHNLVKNNQLPLFYCKKKIRTKTSNISKTLAEKYFGSNSAIGKLLAYRHDPDAEFLLASNHYDRDGT